MVGRPERGSYHVKSRMPDTHLFFGHADAVAQALQPWLESNP
jgi:hypothetical protein